MGILTSCEVRCRKDVVTLMMLFCRRCGFLEHVVPLIMLLQRRWCSVEDVVVLKMLLRRCFFWHTEGGWGRGGGEH